MKQFDILHKNAIELTKNKVMEDMENFLGQLEDVPNLDDYLEQRKTYLNQIWLNVWLTKAGNDFSKREKKAYLSEQGFVVEGVDRKLINKLFRNEIRSFKPFNVPSWVKWKYKDSEWSRLHRSARRRYLKRLEEDRLAKARARIVTEIRDSSLKILDDHQETAYLTIRHLIAKDVKRIIQNKPRYKAIDPNKIEEKLTEAGSFSDSVYRRLNDVFKELTGAIHHPAEWGMRHFEYETYYYYFEQRVIKYFAEFAAEQVMVNLPDDILKAYEKINETKLTLSKTKKMIEDLLLVYTEGFLYKLQEEYTSDLLALADLPYEVELHKEILHRDLMDRERRKAEELAEIQRKKEEEERIIEDIFGREYNSAGRENVKYILHIGETNTGKTHRALERMKGAKSGLYLAPLRLLALEVHEKLNSEGVPCSLKTGEEEKVVVGALHVSCTVEMFYEKEFHEVVVIDEAQMLADKDRGFSWYKAITRANANEVHIIGSLNIKDIILGILGDGEVEIHEYKREVPLQVEKKEFRLNHSRKGDALVCFSRRQVLETASRLQNAGRKVSLIYGSMPPETRRKQIQRFINGETNMIVATDAIGMGLNLPIRRIVFLENEKFDGTRRRRLTSQEVKQIAGRAGRKGIYNVGKVAFTSDIDLMNRLLEKKDEPVETFSIAPTTGIFERFQKYSRSLEVFFELWDKFESPQGTKKAGLSEERDLYEYVRDREIEKKLQMMELYGYLHLPFSKKEPALIKQWLDTIHAIVSGEALPEPPVKTGSLEDLELSYKAIGLHLLFLYKIGRKTEAVYWERIRTGFSDDVHEYLKSEVKNYKKKCRLCGKGIDVESPFQICDTCHSTRSGSRKKK